MDDRNWNVIFLIILIGTLIAVMTVDLHGKIMETKATVVYVAPTPTQTPQWTILDKILEPDQEFDSIKLFVGTQDIVFYEEEAKRDKNGIPIKDKNGNIVRQKIKQKEPEREIALKLLDTDTGKTETIKIRKRGTDIVNPPGYQIEVIERINGIKWNSFNTYYRVLEPSNRIVIKNVWPIITGTGKNRKVEMKVYVPFSKDIGTPEAIDNGLTNLKQIVTSAKDTLRENQVMSKAFPNRLVADVLPNEFYLRRAVMERTDYAEILLAGKETVDMFLAILGSNGINAFSNCNAWGACGMFQFTDNGSSGTYRTVVRTYPNAYLIKDFKIGSFDHVNSAMAAMLLDDMNLAELVRRYGPKIINDPQLEEYLAASYNGAPRWVFQSLNATLGKNIEWGRYLKSETKGFMVKRRFLRDNKLP